ncbi:hypothetical protein CWI37_0903p0010 [Hamiltosporidium tvaerminnensis]|uniref:Uncharacterized protein n=1 Tax=Hamiltosporidium tvaerminnensis TaxID=1176355 RepID=A0A4Q9L1C6_9MICR|nr:hypothetical protein CWI37_0903p0010 [Hamiltosporidium tvaerminnensis]
MEIRNIVMKSKFLVILQTMWCSNIAESNNLILSNDFVANPERNDEVDLEENRKSIKIKNEKIYLKFKSELLKKDTTSVSKILHTSLNKSNKNFSQNPLSNKKGINNHYSYFERTDSRILNPKTRSDVSLKSNNSNLCSTSIDESDTETSNISSIYSSSDLSYDADIETSSDDFYPSLFKERHDDNNSANNSINCATENMNSALKKENISVDIVSETEAGVKSNLIEAENSDLQLIKEISPIHDSKNSKQNCLSTNKRSRLGYFKYILSSTYIYVNEFLKCRKLPSSKQKCEEVTTESVTSSNRMINNSSSVKTSLNNLLTTIKIKISFTRTKGAIFFNRSFERISKVYQSTQTYTIEFFHKINIVSSAVKKILKINDILYILKYIICISLNKSEGSQKSYDNTPSFLIEESVGLDDSIGLFTIDEDFDIFLKNIFKGFISKKKALKQMKSQFKEIILNEFKNEIKNKNKISMSSFIERLNNKDTTLDIFITANFSDLVFTNHSNESDQNEKIELINKSSSPDQDINISKEVLDGNENVLTNFNISRTNDSFLLEDLNENTDNNSLLELTFVNDALDIRKEKQALTELESSKQTHLEKNDNNISQKIDSENDMPVVIFLLSFLFITVLISLIFVLFKKTFRFNL